MKKTFLALGLLCMAVAAFAQKSKIRTAHEYLDDKNYKKAIPVIDEAVASDETKTNPDAWYYRGLAYLYKAFDTTNTQEPSLTEASNSFEKVLTLKPDYSENINNLLFTVAQLYFNEAVADDRKKDYGVAYTHFMKTYEIYKIQNGSRYNKDTGFKKIAISARTNAAYMAFNDKKYDQTAGIFEDLKNDPSTRDTNTYIMLLDVYQQQSNPDKMLSTIEEARRYYPNNHEFRIRELNYYINSGKMDLLLPKLEEAVKADPNNDELLFNLANAYEKLAFPKDANGKDLPRPANYNDYFSKAENTYASTVKLKPNNPDYNYNFGVIYYNSAAAYNKQLQSITGMSAADQKKYNGIKAQMDAEFDKAFPYLDKAYTLLDTKSNMTMDDKNTYLNTMQALREIYSRRNNKAKVDELKKKIDSVH